MGSSSAAAVPSGRPIWVSHMDSACTASQVLKLCWLCWTIKNHIRTTSFDHDHCNLWTTLLATSLRYSVTLCAPVTPTPSELHHNHHNHRLPPPPPPTAMPTPAPTTCHPSLSRCRTPVSTTTTTTTTTSTTTSTEDTAQINYFRVPYLKLLTFLFLPSVLKCITSCLSFLDFVMGWPKMSTTHLSIVKTSNILQIHVRCTDIFANLCRGAVN